MSDAIEYIRNNTAAIVKAAARRRLLNFARYMMPRMEVAPFHRVYYSVLDAFAHGKIKKLIVQMPPQHGKSQGSSRFLPAFMLGIDPSLKIGIGSYSTLIARDFNRDVQRIIDSDEYRELFPNTFLSGVNVPRPGGVFMRNSDVFEVVGRGGSLRAVGRGGSLTSKTLDVVILDDVYKDYAEGNSPIIREAAWRWYTTVVRTRLHNDSKELIVFTRWNEDDIIGRLEKSDETIINVTAFDDLQNLPPSAWVRINFEAIKESDATEIDPREQGAPLWPSRHSLERLLMQRQLDPVQFNCLYQGRPDSVEGRLYQPFRTYTSKDEWGAYVRTGCYIDVADEGRDYLVAVCYDVYKSEATVYNERTHKFEPILFALVTDVVMSDKGTEETLITVPEMINRNNVQRVWVESNGGGAQFEKSIRKKVRALTTPFAQTANKESRILTAASMVNVQIIMPFGWEQRYPVFYDSLTRFLRDFKANAHDDAADAITAIYEKELSAANARPYSMQGRGITVH